MKLGEAIYKAEAEASESAADDTGSGEPARDADEDIVDADFEDVEDGKRK